MIAWLNGILIYKTPSMIILDVNNVGYQVQTPLSTFYSLPELKNNVGLYIHTHVRADAILLFGFMTRKERELFNLLLGVSGIGPKLAVTILSGLTPDELIHAVQKEDLARLSSIPGIGKKTAGRILLELTEKIASFAVDAQSSKPSSAGYELEARSSKLEEVLSALVNLGYNRPAVRAKIEPLCQSNPQMSLEELIKESLKLLGKGS